MKGIDISHWQNGLDLYKIDFNFVIMKATEGTSFLDPCCASFYQKAKSMGKHLGVYHYANGTDYKEEADYFINRVKDYIGEAILVLDWESHGNLQWNKNDREWIENWCNYVYSQTHVMPVIYIQKSAMDKIRGLAFPLWIAQYADNKPTGYQETPWNEGAYACVMRQYSSCGRLSGYDSNLDLDKFYGDSSLWNRLAGKTTAAVNVPEGSTLELAIKVMQGTYGNGEDRKIALGSRYNEVQDFINHINSSSIDVLVEETNNGKYGNGEDRKIVLGSRYSEVQNKINEGLRVEYTVKPGDVLSGIAYNYGVAYQDIAKLNGITDPNKIYVGQTLRIR